MLEHLAEAFTALTRAVGILSLALVRRRITAQRLEALRSDVHAAGLAVQRAIDART